VKRKSATAATPEQERRGLDFDQLVLGSTVAVIVLVALFAAYVSYGHAFELIHSHGESRSAAVFGSGTVDGLVYASGMVLLQAARYRRRAPWLAYFGLWLGIVATIGANMAHGLSHGYVGAVVSAWPAVALITAYELLMKIIRTGAAKGSELEPDHVSGEGEQCPHAVALTAQQAAVNAWFHRTECLGEKYSQRQLATDLEITNRKKLAAWIEAATPKPAPAAMDHPIQPPAKSEAPVLNGKAPA
jgi:hypothetical protein